MKISRRALLGTTALIPAVAVLAACQSQTPQTIAGQVLADLQGVVPVGQAILSEIETLDPSAIARDTVTDINNWIAAATTGLTTLSTSTPAQVGVSTVQAVENDITAVFQAIGKALPAAALAVPAIEPFVDTYDAAVALLPAVEAWITSVLPTSAAAAVTPLKPVKTRYSATDARRILKIKTVQ